MSDSSSTTSVAGDDARRRRWLQFSMKGLFAVVTLFALVLGWLGHDRGWWRPRRSILAAEAVRDAARRGYDEELANFEAGLATFEQVCEWSWRWMEAECEVAANRDDKASAALAHVQRIDQLRQRAQPRNVAAAAYHFAKARAQAEQLRPNASVESSLQMLRALQGTWRVESVNPPKDPSYAFGPVRWTQLEFAGERVGFASSGGYEWALLTIDASTSPAMFKAGAMNNDYYVSHEGTISLDGDTLTLHIPATKRTEDSLVVDEPYDVTIRLKRWRVPAIGGGAPSGSAR